MLKDETVQISTQGVSPEKIGKMEEKSRKTGIDVVGDAPFGTHFCLFYGTKEDLIDVLVPYFKAGLESNEFCMWVTSEPLSEEEAQEAMRRDVPNFDGYVERGQIEIVPHTEWYLKGGAFNLQRVLNGWVEKLNQALAKGYDGMRLTGNTFWLEKRDWKNFDYEREVNDVIGKYRMIALCAYSLEKCGASEVIDVVRNHQFAVVKREGKWELIESSEFKRSKETLRESEEKFRNIFENANDALIYLDRYGRILDVNRRTIEVFGGTREELIGKQFTKIGIFPFKEIPTLMRNFANVFAGKKANLIMSIKNKKGQQIVLECSASLMKIDKSAGMVVIARDMSERKKAEESMRQSEEKYRGLFESTLDGIVISDTKGVVVSANQAAAAMLGYKNAKELVNVPAETLYEDPQDRRVLFKLLAKKGTVKDYEVKLKKKDGKTFDVRVTVVLQRDLQGNVLRSETILRDITERKKAEESLRESEEKNRKTIENANVGIIVYGPEGEVKVLNPKMEEITGFNRTEIPTLVNWFEKLYPNEEERRKVRDKWFKRMSGEGEVKEGHAIITTKEGKRRNFLFNAVQLESGDSIAFAHDITERKKAEEELRETKNYLDNLLNYANAPIIVWDNENKISLFNNAFEALTGYKKESVLGRNIDVLFPPLQKEEILQTIEKATKGEKWQSVEVPILCKGKETRIALWNSANITNKDGNIVATIAQGQDITERKMAEEKLDESEKKFRAIFEGARDGILAADAKTKKFVLANPRILELTGYSEKELLRLGVEDIHPEKDLPYVIAAFSKQLQRKIEIGRDMPVLRKDRNVIYCDINSYLLEIGERKLLVGLFRDVTERRKMEEQLKEYSEHLEEKVEEKTNQLKKAQEQLLKAEKFAAIGEVAAMVGHDLRNPLQVITNMVYLSEKKSKSVPITKKEVLEKHGFLELRSGLKEQVEYMEKIVSDLQDYARPVKPTPVEIGLHQLINKTLSSLTVPENVKVSIVVEKDFPKLMLDPALMQRVFSNLITNAVQAMPNGGKLTIRASKKEETALISIEDTGAGISDENLSKLFTPLFTTKAKGQGFGLPVCKRLVEAHDGNITVESKVGKGSTFTIKIPLRKEVSYN